ncbi:MAG: AAA family ATPase [Pseudomonadota bacterium]
MRNTFVETSNVRRFFDTLRSVETRGAVESCLMIVDGAPGLGKTAMMSRFVAQTGSVYLRAHQGWNHTWFVEAMLKELAVPVPHKRVDRWARLSEELMSRNFEARTRNQTFSIVIDECDLVSSRAEIMETIRDISDVQLVPTILVGMGKLRENIRRFLQIQSRAPHRCEFQPATLEDATKLITELSEVTVAPDLIRFAWEVSRGFNRELMDAIANIERIGRRIDTGATGLTLADMAGETLVRDRDTGKPIVIPEAVR